MIALILLFNTFLPLVMFEYRPCQRVAGIAWYHDVGDAELAQLCADTFYHYGWYRGRYLDRGGLPIFWSPLDARTDVSFVTKAEYQLGRDYDGIVLAFNECMREEQCNLSPRELAVHYRALELQLPRAKIVGPNFDTMAARWDYVTRFIEHYMVLYGRAPKPYRWAVHAYHLGAVDEFCQALQKNSLRCHDIWVTEANLFSCNVAPFEAHLNDLFTDSRIEKVFIFTNRNYGCLALLDGTGRPTPKGAAYLDFMRRR